MGRIYESGYTGKVVHGSMCMQLVLYKVRIKRPYQTGQKRANFSAREPLRSFSRSLEGPVQRKTECIKHRKLFSLKK